MPFITNLNCEQYIFEGNHDIISVFLLINQFLILSVEQKDTPLWCCFWHCSSHTERLVLGIVYKDILCPARRVPRHSSPKNIVGSIPSDSFGIVEQNWAAIQDDRRNCHPSVGTNGILFNQVSVRDSANRDYNPRNRLSIEEANNILSSTLSLNYLVCLMD